MTLTQDLYQSRLANTQLLLQMMRMEPKCLVRLGTSMWKMNDLRKTTAFMYDSYVNNGTAGMSIKGHLIINV